MTDTLAPGRTIRRRNIHTYPFKYEYLDYEDFFRPETAVLYVHIPFCLTKCGFCDYTVYVGRTDDQREEYVQHLLREIRAWPGHRQFPAFDLEAIYLGGGTPGLLEAEQLVRIIAACQEVFTVRPGAEICVEFDPSTVTDEKLEALRGIGVSRISLGVQSFDDHVLRTCGRSHDVATAVGAIEQVRDAGFDHLNVDLIFPLPGQSMDNWITSVDRAIALEPGCITAYGLEVWPKTAFHHQLRSGMLTLPTVSDELRMFRYAIDALDDAGYVRQSTSGYYHPDRCDELSRFLTYYWRTWPMIGLGVSSKTVIHDRLYTNVRPLRQYYDLVGRGQIPLDFATRLTKGQEMRRVIIRGLKMCEISKPDFEERFGVALRDVYGGELDALQTSGLLAEDETRYFLTRQGQLYSTNVFEHFYAEEDLTPAGPGEVRFGISELMD